MAPVLSRRALAQDREWQAEARRDRLRLRASNWQEACDRAGSYDNSLLNNFRIERSALRKSDPGLFRRNILSPVAAMLNAPDLTVTDFGGSTGELGMELLTAFPNAVYMVVEHPELVEMIQARGKSEVRFSSQVPERCSIFYTSGVIQYLENSESILAQGFSSARNALILRRTFMSDNCVFEVQKSRLFDNGYGEIPAGFDDQEISYPRRTISESQLFRLASDAAFECVYSVNETPNSEDGIYAKEYVFRRHP